MFRYCLPYTAILFSAPSEFKTAEVVVVAFCFLICFDTARAATTQQDGERDWVPKMKTESGTNVWAPGRYRFGRNEKCKPEGNR